MDVRITTFLAKAREVQDSYPLVRALCKAELQDIDLAYSTEASRKTRLTAYRNALRNENLCRYFLKALRLPRKRMRALKAETLTKVHTAGRALQPIDDHQPLIDRARQCIKSNAYSVMLPGLMLLSGRRPVELCITGDFCEDENLDADHVWFVGQAKTRDAEQAQKPYSIPLLCDPTEFVDAWKRFLTLKDFSAYAAKEPGQAVDPRFKQFSAQFNEAYRRYFGAVMPAGTSLYDLRDVYALLAYHLCQRPESHVAINLYLQGILGHGQFDVATAQCYQKYYLAEFPRPALRG